MAIRFECPVCRNPLSAKDGSVGRGGQCKCGTLVIVPGHPEKMKFSCPHCRKAITISNRHAGKKGRCPLCKGIITVPLLGILLKPAVQSDVVRPTAPESAASIRVTCVICNTSVSAPQSSAGNIIECAQCGSFMEVPGKQSDEDASVRAAPGLGPGLAESEAGGKTALITGKSQCPSCEHKLPDTAPVCTRCGIFVKSGRPILTAWDVDPDELEDKAHGIVKAVSWLIPFGIYPVYSEAMGNHKPYATWGIAVVTVLISLWFLALELTGSTQMMSAKNLMLWGSGAEPDAEQIQLFYEFTSYGDTAAFVEKREELSETTPEEELDIAALNALTDKQRCFGEFRFYQLITHAFLHGGLIHLAGNMLFLLVLGSRVNTAIGNILMVILYPILAIAAALTYLFMFGSQPPTPMLGASGAVMGLAGAYLLLFPIHKIYMVIWMRWGLLAGFHLSFKCFAVRGFWVVLFYIMFDVIAVSLMLSTGTAHWAHIGGLSWGFMLAFILLTARLVYSRSDILSLVLGKHAWKLLGTPAERLK